MHVFQWNLTLQTLYTAKACKGGNNTQGIPCKKTCTFPVRDCSAVQNENTSIQYPIWFLNTEVSVSVFNLKNTEAVSVSVYEKYWSISIQYQYFFTKIIA